MMALEEKELATVRMWVGNIFAPPSSMIRYIVTQGILNIVNKTRHLL